MDMDILIVEFRAEIKPKKNKKQKTKKPKRMEVLGMMFCVAYVKDKTKRKCDRRRRRRRGTTTTTTTTVISSH